MTKALICHACNAVKSFAPDGADTVCDCGKVHGWWSDAIQGLAVLHTPDPADRHLAHILSLHNGVLNDGPTMIPESYYDAITGTQVPYPLAQKDTFWRQIHQQAGITPPAPETVRIFDASSRACWAVIIDPGTTADTQWSSEPR